MKIAVPTNIKNLKSKVYNLFGHAPFFCIYDTEAHNAEYIINTAASNQGGAGIMAAQLILEQGVEAIITSKCGGNAMEIFDVSNVKVFLAFLGSVSDNIRKYEVNQLALLTDWSNKD